MPVTFGSFGDIISLSLIIKDLVKSLDNSRGSSAEYQAVIRELWSLDHALIEVGMLLQSCEPMIELSALSATVKESAEQCRKCIMTFQDQIKKYEKSLRSDGSGSFIRDTALKIRWQVSKKDDLAKFRAEISAHCFAINMLLTTTGVTLTKLNDANLHISLKHSELSRTKSSATQSSELAEIKSRLGENNALAKEATSEVKKLSLWFDVNYFKNLGGDMLSFMRKIWRVNFLTYKAVISLQTSIPAQLERCWTQEPAILEDALGRVSQVHLEFLDCWEAFEAVLEVRFRKLPGHRKIEQKEYALRINALKKDVEQSLAFNRCFLPGQRIDMSMIFDGGSGGVRSCPGCKVVTSQTEEESDSQVQCPRCKIWYQRVLETFKTELKSQDTQQPTSRPRKRQRIDDEEYDDNPAQFRRVRLRYWDQSHELGSSLAYAHDISADFINADDGPDPKTRENSIHSRKRRDSPPFQSDSFNMPKFHPANLNPLSHPIGTSYTPNAQLMYSFDEESNGEAELPDWNARMSQSSQPAGESAEDADAFTFSAVDSNPSIHALGSNSVFNEGSRAFATPSQVRYESMVDNPLLESSDVVQDEMYEEEDNDLPLQYRQLTAHLQTGSTDFNRRLAAYLTNHVAMRSALDQAITNSYAQQYPNTS